MKTRENPALVVFWTLYSREDYKSTRYKKTKQASEFSEDTDPQVAIDSILDEFGRVTDKTPAGRATLSHAIISSHRVVQPLEHGEIETWEATQDGLFDGPAWQELASYKKNEN